EYSKNFFESRGIPSEKIVITGNPLMDDIFRLKPKADKIKKQLGLPAGAKLIVYASCNPIDIQYWTEEETAHLVRLLNKIVLNMKNCFLLIRPHPTEPNERYLRFLQGEDTSKTFVSKKENLYDLLASCDLLITEGSVVGSEAAAMGKPVIIVNLTGKPYLNRYYPKLLADEGVAIEVLKEYELDNSIKRLLKSKDLAKNRWKFIRKYFYKLDEMSSQRVASLIEKLARGRGG
ncbi:MAG: CDP-glycerol glycerophosphotransferase family protein, partial [Candidatus Hadarchaeales archaeon]